MHLYMAHETAANMEDGWLGWLNWSNAELSLKGYWRGPRSQVWELTWCLTSTATMRFIRAGEMGEKGVRRWGKREIIYLSLHCHHQNDSCIKMGIDASHFNV